MKQLLIILGLALIPLSLHAETEIRMRGMESRISSLEAQMKSHYQQITPNAGPSVVDGFNTCITTELLYWSPRVDGLTYVHSGLSNFNTPVTESGSMYQVDWLWDPGFKWGIGHNFNHDGWDICVNYTWLFSDADDSKNQPNLTSPMSLLPPFYNLLLASLPITQASFPITQASFPITQASFPITQASAKWSLHFHVIDLELGRNFFISNYLTLRPHIGIKGTFQNEIYKVRYHTLLLEDLFIPSKTVDSTISTNQDFLGIGMRAGLDSSWYFSKWFSFYGNMSFSGLCSDFRLKFKNRSTSPLSTNQTPGELLDIVYQRMHFYVIRPVIEFDLGLRCECWLVKDRYHISISAGWEEQIWINQFHLVNVRKETSRHDLTLGGLTTALRFDF